MHILVTFGTCMLKLLEGASLRIASHALCLISVTLVKVLRRESLKSKYSFLNKRVFQVFVNNLKYFFLTAH